MLLQNISIHAAIKLKCRKQRQNVHFNRKNLKGKSSDLTQLRFSGKTLIRESMFHENHQLPQCRKLKTGGRIHQTCFFSSTVSLKLTDNGPVHKILYIVNIENIQGNDDLDECINIFSVSIVVVFNVDIVVVIIVIWVKVDLIYLIQIWCILF